MVYANKFLMRRRKKSWEYISLLDETEGYIQTAGKGDRDHRRAVSYMGDTAGDFSLPGTVTYHHKIFTDRRGTVQICHLSSGCGGMPCVLLSDLLFYELEK